MSGSLIIVSAPSGAGKTTILRRVMADVPKLAFSVSHTTRLPREGEQDGKDYYFVDTNHFKKMIQTGDFLEWAQVHDNYYGTAFEAIRQRIDQGYDVVLDIDVQGADIVRGQGAFPAIYVFIAPPDLNELEKRLRGRGTEDEDAILRRLKNGGEELQHSDRYDHLVINDQVDDAVRMLCAIIYDHRADNREISGRKSPSTGKDA